MTYDLLPFFTIAVGVASRVATAALDWATVMADARPLSSGWRGEPLAVPADPPSGAGNEMAPNG